MLTALLIALSLAFAPLDADAAKHGFKHKGFKGKFPVHKKPANNGFKKTTKVFKSRAVCKSVASTKNFSAAKSVHVRAIAKAFKYACAANPKHDYVKNIYKVWKKVTVKKGKAFAFAKAIAATKTTCRSRGNAYGCATAYAFSSAWAKANARALAKAWAEAIQVCKCDGKLQVQAAQADAYAKESKKLIAKVKAVASSQVCTGKGRRRVSASDYQVCIQDIYAWVHAKAIAVAAIKGKCVAKKYRKGSKAYGHFTSKALADAQATIKVTQIKGCKGKY